MRQTSRDWENVRLDKEVGLVKVHGVQLHQDAPERHGLVRHPADEKREHDDCNRSCDPGLAPEEVVVHAAEAQEAQEQHVAHAHDQHGENEAEQNFLQVVQPEPVVTAGETHQAQVVVQHFLLRGEDHGRSRGDRGEEPEQCADPAARACAVPPAVLQRGRHGPVARDAHGREEEHARVHVHDSDREHHLAHDVAERPAEVARGVHGPEG